MTISHFTKENGLKRPSIDYYAFRTLPYRHFQALQVIYALFHQLQALPTCSEDIHVVRHKTHFWMTQIQAAYSGTPSHPLALDLKKMLQSYAIPQKEWVNIITAIEMQTDCLLLEDEEEFAEFADRLYGSLFRMLVIVLDAEYPAPVLRRLAQARSLLFCLQSPDEKGVQLHLSDIMQQQVYTYFELAADHLKGSLRVLAKLYQHQAKQPMVNLSPLKLLWLSTRERLSS